MDHRDRREPGRGRGRGGEQRRRCRRRPHRPRYMRAPASRKPRERRQHALARGVLRHEGDARESRRRTSSAGPCSTSAEEKASAWIAQVSFSFSAASIAIAKVAPRPSTNSERAAARLSTMAAGGGASARVKRRGQFGERLRRAPASRRQAATRLAPATRPAIIDLVAATERSGPAASGSSNSASAASGESVSLTKASVSAPARLRRALHLDDVGALAGLRDRDAERALQLQRRVDRARRSRARARRRARRARPRSDI